MFPSFAQKTYELLSLLRMGATFAVAAFSVADLASPVRCWKTFLGVDGVLDLSLILGGDGGGTVLWGGDGVPSGDCDTCLLYTSPSPRDS